MSEFSNHLYEAIRHLRPAFRHIAASVETRSAILGLSTGTRACLEILKENGDLPVPEIAKSLMVERQYIQRNVNELLDRQLVIRKPNPKHKRSTLISITETGSALICQLKEVEGVVLDELDKRISSAQIDGAIHVLSTLSQYFKDLNENDRRKADGASDDC